MSQFLGEEQIRIRPDASTFRVELEAQIAAAMQGVQAQVVKVHADVGRAAAAAVPVAPAAPAAVAPPPRIVLPPGVEAAQQQARQAASAQAAATRQLGNAAAAAETKLEKLAATQRQVAASTRAMQRDVTSAQAAVNAYERAMLTATAASRGFAQAQTQVARAAAAATPAGRAAPTPAPQIVLPPGVRTATPVVPPAAASAVTQLTSTTNTAATATTKLGASATQTSGQLSKLTTANLQAARGGKELKREIGAAEESIGRYSRGLFAATAASTGFFRAVSFASGAFLVGATVGASIGAAVNEFTNMVTVAAQTTQLIKSTGGAAGVTAKQVDELSKSVLRLTGVDDEAVKQGANVLLTFRNIRNEAGQGNDVFNRAVKAVSDISSVFRTDLRGSALQLGKALQDPVRGVTALRRSGISLTQGQRDLIKQLVNSGALLTAQKLILGEVEQQVGKTADAIGKTLPGQLRIMREEALNSLGDLVDRLSKSQTAANAVAGAAQGFAQAWSVVRGVLGAVGPSLLGIAQGLGRTVQAVGGFGVILGAAAAYKAVTTAAALAAGAQRLYATASAGAAQAALAQAVATGKVTVELEANAAAEISAARAAQRSIGVMTALSGVFAIGAAASGQWQLALLAGGGAILGIASKARAAVIALRATGAAVTAFSVASAALGGPLGIAAIAAGALAIGLFKVFSASRSGAGSLDAATKALEALNVALDENLHLRAAVGTAREKFGVAQFDTRGAERDLQRAQEALTSTQAAPGSLQFRFLEDQVRVAQQNLTKAIEAQRRAQVALDAAREKSRINEQNRPAQIKKLSDELVNQIAVTRRLGDPGTESRVTGLTQALMTQGLGYAAASKRAKELAATELAASGAGQQAVQQVIDRYQKLGETQKGASAEAAKAIFAVTSVLNKIPSEKQLRIIVRTAEEGGDVNKILEQLGILSKADIQPHLEAPQLKGVNATLREQFLIARGILKAERDKLTTINTELFRRREVLRAAKLERQAAQDAVTSARDAQVTAHESFDEAQRGLVRARRDLADAIRDSARAVADARRNLSDARANLADTINQTLRGVASAQRALLEAQQNLTDVIKEQARSVREARQNLVDTIKSSGIAVADAITSARTATNDAIQSAKGNLLSLNDALADSIAKFLEKTGTGAGQASSKLLAIRQQIIRGGGGPETIRAAQRIQFDLQSQTPAVDTDKIKQQFEDLTDSFVRGKINLKSFDSQFDKLTKGIDISKFREMFGTAAANEFLDTLRTSKRQAVLINESPKRIGGAIAQQLVNPLKTVAEGTKAIAAARQQATKDIAASKLALSDALAQQTKSVGNAIQAVSDAADSLNQAVVDGAKAISNAQRGIDDAQVALKDAVRQQGRNIGDAQQGVADAVRGVTRAAREIKRADQQLAASERRLRQAQHKELIANTREVKQNRIETKQLRLVIAARKALIEVKPKPTGDITAESNSLRIR